MVSEVFKNGGNFLMKTQKTIISAASVIAITYGMSAVLSLIRSRLLAGHFGTSDQLAVFYTADKIPSLIYSLLVVGTISTVFIPVFTSLIKKDRDSAWATASTMINMAVLAFGVLGTAVFVFAPALIKILSVYRFTSEQVALGASLMRIMITAQLLLVLSSFISSLLQSFKYFILPALAPVFYNLGMIAGIVYLTPKYGIYGPAYGVIFGSVLHLLIQLPIIKRLNFNYKFNLDFKDKGIKEVLRLTPPRIFGAAVVQFSSTINNSLAILVSTSSVVVFRFADQLQSFPVNLFGASIALAALPTLSFEAGGGDNEKFKKTFLTSFFQMLFLVVPASVILLVLRVPLVRLVFGAANFPWEDTVRTSYVLAFFSLSVFAQSSVYLLTRAFFALKDTLTPVKISFLTIFISTGLSLFFINSLGWGVWAVALAYSIASITDAFLLLVLLGKKVGGFNKNSIIVPFTKISYAAIFMGVSLYIPLKLLDQLVFDTTRTVPLIALTGITTLAGIISYLLFTWLFKVEEIQLFYKLLRKLNIRKTPLAETTPEPSTDTL